MLNVFKSLIFLHWIPKPSACLDTLVSHTLLKFNPTLQRYSLIQEFFLHNQAEENEVKEEKHVFKIGFSFYFAKYWNSFHDSLMNHDYNSTILAALDLAERHNFELVTIFFLELGLNVTNIQSFIANTEIFVTNNYQSHLNYLQHLK